MLLSTAEITKRVRDSADIQSDIDNVTKEINDVEAQVHKTEAAVEQATQDRNSARATLREKAKKLENLNLSEQERAVLFQLCVADLTDANNDLEELRKDLEHLRKEKEHLRKEKEQLCKEKEQLRKKEEQLREEKLQQGGAAAGRGLGSVAGAGAAAGQGSTAAIILGAGALNQKLDSVLTQQQAISLQQHVISQQQQAISQQQQAISQQQQAFLTAVTAMLASAHLPPSSLNSAARQSLRKEVLLKYNAIAMVDGENRTWCLVTGRFWPQIAEGVPHVRACHIFQRKWGIAEWAALEVGPSPDTPINVIPIHAGVEHAFDALQVIVLPSRAEEDGETIFTVHVLDPELLQKTVYGEFKSRQHKNSTSWVEPPPELAAIKFMDIDKTPLKFRPDSDMRPAKQCFMAHALWGLMFAEVRKWPVDPGISVTVDSFGWRLPTFMQARERTQQWVHMLAASVAAGPPAGSIDELLEGSIDELPEGSIDELQTVGSSMSSCR